MPQRLLTRNTLLRVNLQAFLDQRNQLTMILQQFLKTLQFHHFLYILQMPVPILIIYAPTFLEYLCQRTLATLSHPARETTRNLINHVYVIDVVMDVEKKVSGEKLHQYTSQRPNITYVTPFTTLKNNLRRTVLSCIDDRTF